MVISSRFAYLSRELRSGRAVSLQIRVSATSCRIKVILEPMSQVVSKHNAVLGQMLDLLAWYAGQKGIRVSDRGHLHSSGRSVVFFYLDGCALESQDDGVADDSPAADDGNDDSADDDSGLPDSRTGSRSHRASTDMPDSYEHSVHDVGGHWLPFKRPRTHQVLSTLDDYAELKAYGVEDVDLESRLASSFPPVPCFNDVVFDPASAKPPCADEIERAFSGHVRTVRFDPAPSVVEFPSNDLVPMAEPAVYMDDEFTMFAEGCLKQYMPEEHLNFNYPFRYIMDLRARQLVLLVQFAFKEFDAPQLSEEAGDLLLCHIRECGQLFSSDDRQLVWRWFALKHEVLAGHAA